MKLQSEESAKLAALGREVESMIANYWRSWKRPLKIQKAMASYYRPLAKVYKSYRGFAQELDKRGFIKIVVTPRGDSYVMPYSEHKRMTDDVLLSLLIELDSELLEKKREQNNRLMTNFRARKRMRKLGASSE